MPDLPTEEQPDPVPGEANQRARASIIGDVFKERRHQLRRGHSLWSDGLHDLGTLSQAAMATIAAADDAGPRGALFADALWPFDYRERPRSDVGRHRLLIKAMALLLAELERLPRVEPDALPPTRSVLLLPAGNEGGAHRG